jgi:hypothetical protein
VAVGKRKVELGGWVPRDDAVVARLAARSGG